MSHKPFFLSPITCLLLQDLWPFYIFSIRDKTIIKLFTYKLCNDVLIIGCTQFLDENWGTRVNWTIRRHFTQLKTERQKMLWVTIDWYFITYEYVISYTKTGDEAKFHHEQILRSKLEPINVCSSRKTACKTDGGKCKVTLLRDRLPPLKASLDKTYEK